MTTTNHHPAIAISYMLIGMLVFSAMDVGLKTLSHDYSSFQITCIRGFSALPFILLQVPFQGGLKALTTQRMGFHLFRAVIGVGMLFCVITCFRVLPLANAYTIFFTAPFLIALLSIPLLKEHVGWHRWLAILIGFIGVIVIVEPGTDSWATVGIIAGFLGALGYALNVTTIRMMKDTESSLAMVFYFTLLVTLLAGLIAMWDWQPIQWHAHGWWILAIGIFASIGQWCLTQAFRLANSAIVAPFEYSALIWAILAGIWFFGDHPTLRLLAGSLIIIGAGITMAWRESLAHQSTVLKPTDPVLWARETDSND